MFNRLDCNAYVSIQKPPVSGLSLLFHRGLTQTSDCSVCIAEGENLVADQLHSSGLELVQDEKSFQTSAPFMGDQYDLEFMPTQLSPRAIQLQMICHEFSEDMRKFCLWERQMTGWKKYPSLTAMNKGLARHDAGEPTMSANYKHWRRWALGRIKGWGNKYHGSGW